MTSSSSILVIDIIYFNLLIWANHVVTAPVPLPLL